MLCLSLFLPMSRMYFWWALVGCTTSLRLEETAFMVVKREVDFCFIHRWIISIRPIGIVCVVHFGRDGRHCILWLMSLLGVRADGRSLAGGWLVVVQVFYFTVPWALLPPRHFLSVHLSPH